MKYQFRWVLALLFVIGLVSLWAGQGAAASDSGLPFSGLAEIEGPLQLDLAVSPPVSSPGETLSLTIRLRNQMKVTVSPGLTLQLPPGLRLETSRMPAGMTLNLQTNELNWLPVLSANGGEQQVTVSVRVETADIKQPARAVTAVLRHEGKEQTVSAPIWIGMQPQIDRILPLPPIAVGQPVQLLADVVGSGPIAQTWMLGDGRQVAVNDPTVVYSVAGTYEIILQAANPLTAVFQTGTITIVPEPAAQFTPDDATLGIGQPIAFTNQSGGQPPLIYRWDFGDGSTTTDVRPTHQYSSPGNYTVHLIVENDFGQSEAFWPVTVGASPVADMEIDMGAPAGQSVLGQAFGDDTVTAFDWDMGDGQMEEGAAISYAYRLGGDYYVRMTASNEYGGTEIGRWVHIEPGQLAVYLPLIMQSAGQIAVVDGDPYGLTLDPVELAEPFVMGPMTLPEGIGRVEQLFLYINEARRQFDLPPLVSVSELNSAAQQHVGDMIAYQYTAHAGYDGSFPAERLLWQGYGAGYAGEATAWGFEHPYQAVEFWINSPPHRRIILNRYATDVGAGFTVDFSAPNVWYWTAEFGNVYAASPQPFIRLDGPPSELELMISQELVFSWNWPLPLESGQQFTVYRTQNGTAVPVGTIIEAQLDTFYSLPLAASNDWEQVGSYEWQVVLEDGAGAPILSSESRAIIFTPDPDLPKPTPLPTAVPTLTPMMTAVPPTPTPFIPVGTPVPTPLPPPVIVTATPAP